MTLFGETLRKDSPQSVRDYAIYSHEFVYDAFRGHHGQCPHRVRLVIDDLFGFLRANPDQETIFHAGMSNRGRVEAAAFLKSVQIFENSNGCGCGWWQRRILICNFGVQRSPLRCAILIRGRPLKRQRRFAVVLCPVANWCRDIFMSKDSSGGDV